MAKVCIVNSSPEYESMFRSAGWQVVSDAAEANFLQFTGGADVSPDLYSTLPHPKTQNNPERDRKEEKLFDWALRNSKPMAGICRGGQFLNVMCGGSMWQHVDNHAIRGTHEAVDMLTGRVLRVTSTHHQMMRPAGTAVIVMAADLSTKKETVTSTGSILTSFEKGKNLDIEALYYEGEKVFCFQPHPEFYGHDSLAHAYLEYLETYILD